MKDFKQLSIVKQESYNYGITSKVYQLLKPQKDKLYS